ncbi:hypothetical protein GA0070563_12023 [Micromonospora carbonacea]|uniref:Uncharacterized protein n=1 Tax=Micromonospora carbonacea TaxID=47853 RepID=A0A1C5AUP6_9ACTN|nr:hypothetical protein GA0070563_12023 [Micromonospora carbonacea]
MIDDARRLTVATDKIGTPADRHVSAAASRLAGPVQRWYLTG